MMWWNEAKRTRPGFLFECCLWLGGFAFVLTGLIPIVRYELFQHVPQLFSSVQAASQTAVTRRAHEPAAEVRIVGRLLVPSLGMNTIVLDGREDESLALGPTHLIGTPLPGGFGNSIIAGHRDSVFHPLRKIKVGDQLQFSGTHTFTYVVRRTFIVKSDDMSVLADQKTAMLTLITCYPFGYIGDAPQRFIVQADLTQAQ